MPTRTPHHKRLTTKERDEAIAVERNPLRGLMSMRQIADRWGVTRQRVHQVLRGHHVNIWTSEAFGKVCVVRETDVRRVERERKAGGWYPQGPQG